MQKILLPVSVPILAFACFLSPPGESQQESAPRDPGLPVPTDGSPVSFSARISHPVALAGDPQEEFLHLALQAAQAPEAPRLGLNLALVIDRSGSMASEDKLRFAQSAAEQVVARLRPDDRLAIVSYDDAARIDVPSTPAGERETFLAAIRALVPGNSTDLHGGLVAGYEEVLANLDEARINAVLLLSDGLANRGVTARDEIARRAAACRERGVRLSTMGLGLDYDEDHLCAIAQNAGGNYHYVKEAETIGAFLDQEIDQMSRVVARNVEARIELGVGVELRGLYGYVHRVEGRTVIVPMRDLYSGQGCKLVLRLALEGRAGERRRLTEASLRYVDTASTQGRLLENPPCEVLFSSVDDEVQAARDPEVLIQAEIVQNGFALDTAMRMQKDGRYQEAQELLGARYLNSKLVNDTEYRSAEVDRTLRRIRQVMLDLERTRSDPRASRDLQLRGALQGLGYMGD